MNNPEIGNSIVVHGIKTNYLDLGDGEPVLMIHGSGPGVTGWANWRLNAPILSKAFRLVIPDMVGFGYTAAAPGGHYSTELWVDHALGLLDQLGIERAHIVGNSFGGGLALAMASRHPDRVNRLVLMGSAGTHFNLTWALDKVWGYKPSIEAMKQLLEIFAFDKSKVSDDLAELRYKASTRPGISKQFNDMFPEPRQRWLDGLALGDDAIRLIEHKALIVHGREDIVVPVSNAYKLHDLISDSRLHVFGRCGHWAQIEHCSDFNNLVLNFLK